MKFLRAGLSAILTGLLALAVSRNAVAKSSLESSYGFDRTWNAATRLVRVDLGFKITERDEASGYLLFEYRSPEGGGKASAGSMEFLRRSDNLTLVLIQLAEMPQYHEQVMSEKLAKKLRAEFGEPPRKALPSKTKKDAGPDLDDASAPEH
jgi:hypothetical protein